MGKDFIPLKLNGYSFKEVIKRLYLKEKVLEGSKEEYFNVLPNIRSIQEIELGTDGTQETIFRLDNEDFIVVEGTLDINCLKV